MAEHHNFSITYLETPWGFLEYNGLTYDVNYKDIITLRENTYGIWTPFKDKVEWFLVEFEKNYGEYISKIKVEEIKSMIRSRVSECKIWGYWCGTNDDNQCGGCWMKRNGQCDFWNGNRERVSGVKWEPWVGDKG